MGTVRHAGVGRKFVSKRTEHQAGFRREGQLLLKFGVLRACLARVNGWSCPPHAGLRQHSSPSKSSPSAAQLFDCGKALTRTRERGRRNRPWGGFPSLPEHLQGNLSVDKERLDAPSANR